MHLHQQGGWKEGPHGKGTFSNYRDKVLNGIRRQGHTYQEIGKRLGVTMKATTESNLELKGTAHHEAGHAVARMLLGKAFTTVTVVPGEGFAGLVEGMNLPLWLFDELECGGRPCSRRVLAEVRAVLVVYLAGTVAEQRFLNKEPEAWTWEQNREDAADFVLVLCGSEEEANRMLEEAWRKAKTLYLSEAEKQKAMDSHREKLLAAADKLFVADNEARSQAPRQAEMIHLLSWPR